MYKTEHYEQHHVSLHDFQMRTAKTAICAVRDADRQATGRGKRYTHSAVGETSPRAEPIEGHTNVYLLCTCSKKYGLIALFCLLSKGQTADTSPPIEV